MSENVLNPAEALVPVVVDFDSRRWPMFKAGAEPLCKDTDLAEWLEFERPRNIRPLIERHSDALGPISLHREAKSGSVGRPTEGYYLTEEQALFIIAKSETPRATWMLKAMIQVFLKARGLVAVAQAPDSFGRLEEWVKMRRAQEVHGEALDILRSDSARLGSELAAQREYIELLDQKVNRDMPSPEQREQLLSLIGYACACRVSERERLMLVHIAEEGPKTSLVRIGAAARVSTSAARESVDRMHELALLDIEQRDPAMKQLRNYYVVAEGLEGHADDCERIARRAIETMKEMTSDAAVHVVPPNIPHIPLPQVQPQQPQLGLQEVEREPPGRSEREELVSIMRSICYNNGLDYHDFASKLYIRMKFEGMDCKKTKKISRIDYMERHGWCRRAIEIAQSMPIHEIRQAQNVGHA